MLSETELKEIKGLLEKSQNPLFFFDNDVDGLCSYLLLQRYLGRGRGIPIRSFPDLNKTYVRKIDELNADTVFILDKPKVSEEFIDEVSGKNIPIVWIDHHEAGTDPRIIKKVHYFNSFPLSEPVTYICYKISGKDEWLAMVGCIGDVFKPGFAGKFAGEFPELYNNSLSAFDSLFLTEIGKVARILNFALKDTTTNVVKMMKFLSQAKNIYDILEENKLTRQIHNRFNQLKKSYDKLMTRAEEQISSSKLIFFTYSGEMSISSEIANGLYFKHKDKFIVVAYRGPDKVNVSIRGKNAKKITEKLISEIEGATGGGHEEATGAQIPSDKFEDFKQKVEELVN
jgi:single-stranded DNA-specific DHH superfamily exonuclease